jgi:hypothetical protein
MNADVGRLIEVDSNTLGSWRIQAIGRHRMHGALLQLVCLAKHGRSASFHPVHVRNDDAVPAPIMRRHAHG